MVEQSIKDYVVRNVHLQLRGLRDPQLKVPEPANAKIMDIAECLHNGSPLERDISEMTPELRYEIVMKFESIRHNKSYLNANY
jgi:hypothetical protein